jgi:hypothetical protein
VATTRLGQFGIGLAAYGVFEPKGEAVVIPEVTETKGTGGRLLRKERWSLTVDGRVLVFSSIDELVYYLSTREVKEEKRARKRASRDAKRIVSRGKQTVSHEPPKVHISSPVIEIMEYVSDVQSKIDQIYWKILAEELSRQAEEKEDIRFIATL